MDIPPDPPGSHPDAPRREQRPRLTPLTAALLIPAFSGVVLAGVWMATHAKATKSPTAVTTPTPGGPTTPPGPSPLPYVWPVEDGGSVDPDQAYGRLAITAPAAPYPALTASLVAGASVPPPGRPDQRRGTVQHVKALDQATIDTVAAHLGARVAPTSSGIGITWTDIGLNYDPAISTFTWSPSGTLANLPLVPRDNDTAARAARGWLLERGLVDPMAPVVATQVSHGDLAAFATWNVIVPHLAGQSDATQITMTVSAGARVSTVSIAHPVVVGGATYRVVSWETAWAQVQAGRSKDITGWYTDTPVDLHVDKVQITARLVQTGSGTYVIPAYSFADSASRITVYWPALDPADYTPP
ncbi:MAG TPA: hypothetical protein VN193_08725 [Candidatus Angelobacter sp.]|nr:hypothetical protein [Candidatus Angelobacter sp.]